MQDAYTSIRNGVYDGYISTVSLAFPYKIHEPAPHFTRVTFGTTTGSGLSINKKTWDGFPAHVKEIFSAVAKEWCDRFTKESDERAKSLVAAMQGQGAQFAPFPAEERRKWAFALPNVPKQWAQDLDKRNLPGTKLLSGYMDGLRGAGVEVVRNWDRE
jgi:TRAP-type C4-dicarboxylate transport system substrate-binding protein